MASAVAVFTIGTDRATWVAGARYFAHGTLAISASPATYKAGGIVCNLNGPLNKASRTPARVTVFGISGFIYAYVKGTDNSNGLLKIFVQDGVSGNPLAEIADATAIAAGISGDTIDIEAEYNGQN